MQNFLETVNDIKSNLKNLKRKSDMTNIKNNIVEQVETTLKSLKNLKPKETDYQLLDLIYKGI